MKKEERGIYILNLKCRHHTPTPKSVFVCVCAKQKTDIQTLLLLRRQLSAYGRSVNVLILNFAFCEWKGGWKG
jgi:hypothetical protein